MTDWTSGYVADIGYTFGYYPELSPLRARLLLLNAGLALPQEGAACELGFGQGVSTNIHAAASASDWHGTDFNPSQAAFARELAASHGGAAKLHDQSFAEFCTRTDLPDFDYIGLHGIWSWISDENRSIIVDFLRRKLKVGGILYISYNTQPGWSAMLPVRSLLTRHAEIMTAPGAGVVAKVDNAIAFAHKLWAVNPAFARANPGVGEKLKAIEAQDRHYVAHEYFNRDWLPMSIAEMADWLETAKLDFACSATPLDHIASLHLSAEQNALLAELPDPVFKQSVRDFMVNQQFRRDYWIKGPRTLNTLERTEQLLQQRLVMTTSPAEVSMTVKGMLGEANMSEKLYRPLLQLMADYRPRTLKEIEEALRDLHLNVNQLTECALVLADKSALAAAQDDAAIAACRPHTDQLNRKLIEQARGGPGVPFLASPVTGGALFVSRFQQLFLLALAQGKKLPSDWADYAAALLKLQRQAILKGGVALQGDEENLAELQRQASAFDTERLPVLRALGIA
jgi:SAM-dependent methyltransferase